MKITCILASYNRPQMIQDALASVAEQTHKDYELLVYDDSNAFDVREAVKKFQFTSVQVSHSDLTPQQRRHRCRLGVNCNAGLKIATGDVITFLCDDDFYYPTWFASVSAFFEANPGKNVAYGRLWYLSSKKKVFPTGGRGLFPGGVIEDPYEKLDHNQVAHRRMTPPVKWPEEFEKCGAPDGLYFRRIAQAGNKFFPIPADAVVKRWHKKNLQTTMKEIGTDLGEGLRE